MGGRFGRRRNQIDPNYYNDPFYQAGGYPPTGVPSPYSYGGGGGAADPYGGLGGYEPDPYGYGFPETDPYETYGGPMGYRPNYYGGRYGRGLSQMSGSPWNYGNFYMGNTTLQMLPMMQRKVAKYALRQGMGAMGGMGGIGGMGGMGGNGCMPMMPMMPCMPMASPMMAVAAPLPVAYNPLIQGMYPVVTANSANWMTPSSFMTAFTNGPMAYRPPPSFELPNNIGMVMTVPYGGPNPLLTPPCFGGFSPQASFNGGLSCCCCYCTPAPAPPPISYYPRPVCVPQPYPVPCPAPVPIPNIQQVPVPRHVTVVAPPIMAGCNNPLSIPGGAPLLPSQGGFTQNGFGQTLVMASNKSTNSTSESVSTDETPVKSKRGTYDPKSVNNSRRAKAQEIAASLSNLGINNTVRKEITSSKTKNRPKLNYTSRNYGSLSQLSGKSNSESDWLTSDTLSDILEKTKENRHGKLTERRTRSHRQRNSISNHNYLACNQDHCK